MKIGFSDVAKLKEYYLELYRRMNEGYEIEESERYIVENLSDGRGEEEINSFFSVLELILW